MLTGNFIKRECGISIDYDDVPKYALTLGTNADYYPTYDNALKKGIGVD